MKKINSNQIVGNIIIGINIIFIIGIIATLLNDIKVNKEYQNNITKLNQIEAAVEFDTCNYFWFGDAEVAEQQLLNSNAQHKKINNNNYFLVQNSETQENFIIKINNNKLTYLGLYEYETQEKQNFNNIVEYFL